MDDMFLYHASHFFEHWISCANQHTHVHIMMDDVYIYHAHTLFLLSQCCVGPHIHSSTSQSYDLTKRALESNEAMRSLGELVLHPSSRKDFTHSFYMDLTWIWVLYTYFLYAHFSMFSLHAMPISTHMTCFGDPCFAFHMIHPYAHCMCICMLGGDNCCYYQVIFCAPCYC